MPDGNWSQTGAGPMAKDTANQIENADGNLIVITYNLITENRHQLARVLLDFATETLKSHSTENYRLTMVVNRTQTYKWTGDEERCKRILDAEDWSATGPNSRLLMLSSETISQKPTRS